jgi:hypothetical protein
MIASKTLLSQRILGFILLGISGYLVSYYLYFHFSIILLPGAQVYQEGAFILNTNLLLSGGNPYLLKYLPHYTEIYGPVYSIVVAPFAKIFGSNFIVHRAVSAFFIFGSCIMVFLFSRLRGVAPITALVGAVLYYILFTSTYSTVSRPDSLGVFLLLVSLFVADRLRYSNLGLAYSIFFGLLAYFTKPYFVFGIPCIALYLFLSRSKIKGILYFLSFFGSLLLILLLMSFWCPYYFVSTHKIHQSFTSLSFSWFQSQLKEFSMLHLGLLLMVLLEGAYVLNQYRKTQMFSSLHAVRGKFNVLEFKKPFLEADIDLITVTVISAVWILLSILGWHRGANMIYFIQLLSPFLIIWVLRPTKKEPVLVTVGIVCLILNFTILGINKPIIPKGYMSFYQHWEELFASGKKILAPPLLVHLNMKNDMPFFDNGHSGYFWHYIQHSDQYKDHPAQQKIQRFFSEFDEKIKAQYFDIILVDSKKGTFYMPKCCVSRKQVEKHYEVKYQHFLPSYYGNWDKRRKFGKGMYLIDVYGRKES